MKYLTLIIALLLGLNSKAQNKNLKYNLFSAGFTFGHITDMPKSFIGSDRAPLDKVSYRKNTRFDLSVGAYAEAQVSPIFGLQLSYDIAQSSGGNDIGYYKGNFNRLNLSTTISLTNITTKKSDPYTNFYSKAGLGVIHFEAQDYFRSGAINENGYRKAYASQINLGLGFRIHLTERIRLELESTYNIVWDNGFDADAFNYQQGQDQYLRTNLGVAYTFGKDNRYSLHKTPVFSSEYLWDDPIIKKKYAPSLNKKDVDDIVQEHLKNINSRVDSLGEKLSEVDKTLQAFVEEFREGQPVYIRNIFFAFDKDIITKEYQKVAMETSMILKANPKFKVDITGVTDIVGTEKYNIPLRVRRAEAVKNLLISKFNISSDRISVNTQKEKISGKPYQHLNRRSTLIVYKKY